MQRVAVFWSENRNELLMTGLIVLLIQLATLLGGYFNRRKKNMRRIGEAEEK